MAARFSVCDVIRGVHDVARFPDFVVFIVSGRFGFSATTVIIGGVFMFVSLFLLLVTVTVLLLRQSGFELSVWPML